MTPADFSPTDGGRKRISIRRPAQRPGTVTAHVAHDALQGVLERRARKRDGRESQAAPASSPLEGAASGVVAALDGLRRQAGIPVWAVSAAVLGAVLAGLLVLVGPVVFRAGPPCPVHPVVGQVVVGKLVPIGAQVVFHPIARDLPDQAVPRALVRDDGSFVVSTFGTDDGAPAGEYVVTVQWFRVSRDGSPGPNVLPRQYAAPDTSPLRVAVNAGRNELTRFEIVR